MSEKKLFVEMLKNEIPLFENIFLALPNKPAEWRAHPKNKSTSELAIDMLTEVASFPLFLKREVVDVTQISPHGLKEMKKISHDFTKILEEGMDIIMTMDDEDWDSPTELMIGKSSFMKMSKGMMSWSLLVDLIHHRGQLSTHIRPQGGKVPAIYGPSGDSR